MEIPTQELQDGQIVTVWFCSYKSKQMIIKFSSRYQNKLIDSIPIDLEDSKRMNEGFCDILQSNRIAEEHIDQLLNMLISNGNRITEFYTRCSDEQTNIGQRNRYVRITSSQINIRPEKLGIGVRIEAKS